MTDLTIRPVLFEELERLYFLSQISKSERVLNKSPDKQEIDKLYASNKELYAMTYRAPDKLYVTAEGPEVALNNPIYGINGKQLFGLAVGCFVQNYKSFDLLITDFYTAKTPLVTDMDTEPLFTGRKLMSHMINSSIEKKADKIKLYAKFPKAAEWYQQEALFIYDNPHQTSGSGYMTLFSSNFADSLTKLNDFKGAIARKNDPLLVNNKF